MHTQKDLFSTPRQLSTETTMTMPNGGSARAYEFLGRSHSVTPGSPGYRFLSGRAGGNAGNYRPA
jgi:hypothetical protein